MKLKTLLTTVLLLTALPAQSAKQAELSTFDYIVDVSLYRTSGFFLTVLGSCTFAITSPTWAIATLFPPHDAFSSSFYNMVEVPFRSTFTRQLGTHYYTRDTQPLPVNQEYKGTEPAELLEMPNNQEPHQTPPAEIISTTPAPSSVDEQAGSVTNENQSVPQVQP